jgi:hypothetical protein
MLAGAAFLIAFFLGWLAADWSRPWRVRRWKRKAEEG